MKRRISAMIYSIIKMSVFLLPLKDGHWAVIWTRSEIYGKSWCNFTKKQWKITIEKYVKKWYNTSGFLTKPWSVSAFRDCDSLSKITVNENNPVMRPLFVRSSTKETNIKAQRNFTMPQRHCRSFSMSFWFGMTDTEVMRISTDEQSVPLLFVQG